MGETDLVVSQPDLLDVVTGELLPATPENAARVLEAAREMKRRLGEVVQAATEFVVEESRRQGTKTLAAGGGAKLELAGGPLETFESVEEELAAVLREAGVPEDRVNAAVYVEETRTLKVDRGVLRQLAAANPEYAAAIGSVRRTVEKPFRVSVRRS